MKIEIPDAVSPTSVYAFHFSVTDRGATAIGSINGDGKIEVKDAELMTQQAESAVFVIKEWASMVRRGTGYGVHLDDHLDRTILYARVATLEAAMRAAGVPIPA